jgi:hypothetical protein
MYGRLSNVDRVMIFERYMSFVLECPTWKCFKDRCTTMDAHNKNRYREIAMMFMYLASGYNVGNDGHAVVDGDGDDDDVCDANAFVFD